MMKYLDNKNLKLIGERLKRQRINADLSRNALSEITGFDTNTIRNIEIGKEISISYFLHICFALDIKPSKILENLTPTKPINHKLKKQFQSKAISKKIQDLINYGFFDTYKSSNDVKSKMLEEFDLIVDSSTLSSLLIRMSKMEMLKVKQEGRLNLYIKY